MSSCTATRARRSAPRSARRTGAQGDQGGARRAAAPTSATLERFHDRLPPARRARAGPPRRHRRDVRLGARARARRATVPLILSRRPDAGQRRRGDRRGRARSRSTSRAASRPRPGVKDPRQAARPSSRRSRRRAPTPRGGRVSAGRRAPLRPLRRPVRPRDADAGARRARGGVARGARRRRLPAPSSSALLRDYVGRPTPLYHAERLSRGGRAARSTSSARTSSTPARTRSTTRSARRCSPSGWASRGSSPRPAPASTASRPRPRARCSASSASSTWAPRTCAASSPTSQRMGLLGATRRAGRRRRAHAQGGRARRRSATGSRTSPTTHYVIGSAVGPAPYPALVRDLQRVIGDEARAQVLEREGRLPAARDRLRRRRLERDRHRSSPFVDDAERRAGRRRGGGRGDRHRPPRRAADGRRARAASCTAPTRRSCRTRTARSSRRTRSRPASTTRASGPSTRYLRDTGRARYVAVTDARGARRVPAARAARGHHPGARVRARARLGARERAATASSTSSASPAAATRTSPRCSAAPSA